MVNRVPKIEGSIRPHSEFGHLVDRIHVYSFTQYPNAHLRHYLLNVCAKHVRQWASTDVLQLHYSYGTPVSLHGIYPLARAWERGKNNALVR